MIIQNQILGTLRAPGSQDRLAGILADEAPTGRSAIGRRVCAEFGFVDARGTAQLAGCLKALRALRRLEADFECRYHYRPWLVETFVGADRDGTSFKAANFQCVGRTAGRGRQDRRKERKRSVKSVYLYELAGDWRKRLGVGFVDAAPSLAPGEGLDGEVWAVHEFGGAELGDKRLSTRLVRSAVLLASVPGQAVTGNLGHDRAAVKGYYRFIDHAADSAVTPAAILAPHRARTVGRMRGQDTVLCIQDGTDLNFATRPNCEGLGIIGRNQTAAPT